MKFTDKDIERQFLTTGKLIMELDGEIRQLKKFRDNLIQCARYDKFEDAQKCIRKAGGWE